MNGTRMWNPALRTPLYRPKRSTTYALCCGTTIVVRDKTISTMIARKTATIRVELGTYPPISGLTLAYVEGQTVHSHNTAALALRQIVLAGIEGAPGAATQFHLAHAAGLNFRHSRGGLADQAVHCRTGGQGAKAFQQYGTEYGGCNDGKDREEQPFEPLDGCEVQSGQDSYDKRTHAEENEVETTGRCQFEEHQGEAQQDPCPPSHRLLQSRGSEGGRSTT